MSFSFKKFLIICICLCECRCPRRREELYCIVLWRLYSIFSILLSLLFLCFRGWLVGCFFFLRQELLFVALVILELVLKTSLGSWTQGSFASQVLDSVCNHLLAWTWFYFECFVFAFLTVLNVIYTRIPSNSEMNCLCLLSSGMKGICHHTWLFLSGLFI